MVFVFDRKCQWAGIGETESLRFAEKALMYLAAAQQPETPTAQNSRASPEENAHFYSV